MPLTLTAAELEEPLDRLARKSRKWAKAYPGDRPDRQPVHTLYGGAHLFSADTPSKLNALARRHLDAFAPRPSVLAAAVGLEDLDLAGQVWERLRARLDAGGVEDLRVDFEDGYGYRPDLEEDAHASRVGEQLALALAAGRLPPFVGVRIKALTESLSARALRTLDLVVSGVRHAGSGQLPPGFVVTLPKVTHAAQVRTLAEVLTLLERALGLPEGGIAIELMVETPQALVDDEGRCPLPGLVAAGEGRVRGCHLGAYDYTAALGVTGAHQSLRHPAVEHARQVMAAALAGTGVWLSDGATTLLPVPPKGETGRAAERRAALLVHRAWRAHHDHVHHALVSGFYQGWDLHPHQLVPRYAALYAFFLRALPEATERLRSFVAVAAQATLLRGTFDDAASGQGLLNFFLRGLACGALGEADLAATGLGRDELHGRSFAAIAAARPQGGAPPHGSRE